MDIKTDHLVGLPDGLGVCSSKQSDNDAYATEHDGAQALCLKTAYNLQRWEQGSLAET